MTNTIKKFLTEKDELQIRINKIDKFIKSLQDLCEHVDDDGKDAMEYKGHDSHKDHYVCKICGDTRSI